MKTISSKALRVFQALPFILISGYTFAYGCSGILSDVDDARLYLQRAAKEQNLSNAQDDMRRARGLLDDASLSANDCHCNAAAAYFDEAAIYARRARDAENRNDFGYQLRRTINAYNSGVDALDFCFQR